MQIESGFNLMDVAISAMHGQRKSMPAMISSVNNKRKNIPDIADTEGKMNTELGTFSRGSLINPDLPPVQMMNQKVAAQAYNANVGLLNRYRQWTETELELLG